MISRVEIGLLSTLMIMRLFTKIFLLGMFKFNSSAKVLDEEKTLQKISAEILKNLDIEFILRALIAINKLKEEFIIEWKFKKLKLVLVLRQKNHRLHFC